MDDLTRFWNKVDKQGPVVRKDLGPCWLWTKALRNGYGTFSIKHKAVAAHRWIYEQKTGQRPRLLRHKCDNRQCVRPDHLEPGTHKDNTQDMLERNSNIYILTIEEVRTARSLAQEGKSMYQIQKILDRPRHILMLAITGRSFGHITSPSPIKLEDIYRPIHNKLTEQDYKEILKELEKPYRGQGKALATKYGVDPSMITLIKKKRLKTIRGASS